MLNLAAAVERGAEFDLIHYQAAYYPMSLAFARLSRTPIVQTLHHSPSLGEVALWARYPEIPFVAISAEQSRLLRGVTQAGIVLHGIDTDVFPFRAQPEDYLLFLGRFTAGKGVLQAIDIARRAGMRLVLAAPEDDYYREHVQPHVDGERVVYAGEVGHEGKVALAGGARALLYPVQAGEPFGLVLAEAMACGTPVAALDRGAVREVVDEGVTGRVFKDEAQLLAGLPSVFALDRAAVRKRAVERFGIDRMVDEYIAVYERIAGRRARD
jgi:glycosyltransferase involved in cell wall biosynthesis